MNWFKSQRIQLRPATLEDSEFLYHLKKQAEGDSVAAVFGWNEKLQREIHHQELKQAFPEIITSHGEAIGSIMVTQHQNHLLLSRFFIHPSCQGEGIGSELLTQLIAHAQVTHLPIKLCYLQGNRVADLYRRFGFQATHQDECFVYMRKDPSLIETV